MITLFNSNSLFRENKIIWRLLETFVLVTPLTDGTPYIWFGVNIPLNLNGISKVDGDIDLMICLLNSYEDNLPTFRYKIWEVKCSLIDESGVGHSLKYSIGKINSLKKQLIKLAKFGCPEVSLLEIHLLQNENLLYEHKFLDSNVKDSFIRKTMALLKNKNGIGYQILPFSHYESENSDIGLSTLSNGSNIFPHICRVVEPLKNRESEPFISMAEILNNFYRDESINGRKIVGNTSIITYCKECKKLILVGEKENFCYKCGTKFLDPDNNEYLNFKHLENEEIG